MKIIKIENAVKNTTSSVMTIGVFDGVHQGHQFVLQQLATYHSLQKILISFENHPVTFLKQKDNTDLVLTPLEEKIKQIEKLNIIDIVYLLPFNEKIAHLGAEDFFKHYILKYFNPKVFLMGYDNHFGKNKEGNFTMLQQLGRQYDMQVHSLAPLVVDHLSCSSTNIRNFLKAGNIEQANQCLGYAYTMEGVVVHGKELGRKIGFPTANMLLLNPEKLIPQKGVYATTIEIEGFEKTFSAMTNIGVKPTIAGTHDLSIETNIFDFEEMIYDKKIKVSFRHFIREEQKFDSLEKLILQLNIDQQQSIKLLSL